MAARILRKQHTDEIRQKIRTSQLVNLLHDCALTGRDSQGAEITPMRLEAAKTLLRKTLPDLSAVEHSGEIRSSDLRSLTDDALADVIAAGTGRAGDSEAEGDSEEPRGMVQ